MKQLSKPLHTLTTLPQILQEKKSFAVILLLLLQSAVK